MIEGRHFRSAHRDATGATDRGCELDTAIRADLKELGMG